MEGEGIFMRQIEYLSKYPPHFFLNVVCKKGDRFSGPYNTRVGKPLLREALHTYCEKVATVQTQMSSKKIFSTSTLTIEQQASQMPHQ